MGTNERRERDKNVMRENILAAAMELFVKEGYDNVSIRKIADKIEYSPATIYLYFRDKDEIIFALHDIAFGKFYQALHVMKPEAGTPRERLLNGGRAYMQFALANRELYDLMFVTSAPGRVIEEKKEWTKGRAAYDLLRNTIHDCVETGLFDPNTKIDAATLAIWGLVHGIAALVVRNRMAMIPDDQLSSIMEGAYQVIADKLLE